MIHLERVSKIYQTANGPVHALAETSMDVSPGEFIVVRGPSGSGKSTLLMIVGGLGRPTSGRVVVGGEDLPSLTASARAKFRAERIGFVFQTFHLVPYLTVVENVAVAALPDAKPAIRARAGELLEEFGLGHRVHHRPAELSTGECQRVAIARAMINRPSLILADEPTGNLDAENAGTVLALLTDFQRRGGTVLLVTHQEDSWEHAQRIVTLRAGKIETQTSLVST